MLDNVLVAVVSCHKYLPDRIPSIRETWLPELQRLGVPYRIFVGENGSADSTLAADVVRLPVDDTYRGLPAKTKAIAKYALENGFDFVFKCDDDVYLEPSRLINSDFAQLGDYIGRKRGPSGGFPAPYASGFSYWLSKKALRVAAETPLTNDPAEDRWLGNALLAAGIPCVADYRYVVTDSTRNALTHTEGPRKGNYVISACEFDSQKMRRVHDEWLCLEARKWPIKHNTESRLSRLSILVKTFLRDGYLKKTVESIQAHAPEAKIVIVDDGYEQSFKISWYAQLRAIGHETLWLPFDSGFGAKANAGVAVCDTEYVLIASDDFDFTADVRHSLDRMINFLDLAQNYEMVSGRVNGRPYEATLEINGDRVIESPGFSGQGTIAGINFHSCDLTVNFTVIRRAFLNKVKWDDDVKIGGGEHGAFFVDVKRAGGSVAYLPGANINEFPNGRTDWMDQQYPSMRARAKAPGRVCLARRGIREWVLQNGATEQTGL